MEKDAPLNIFEFRMVSKSNDGFVYVLFHLPRKVAGKPI